MIKGIKQGQVVVGKVKHPKVGMLPTNLILFAVEGEVEDLGRKLECMADSIHGSSSSYYLDVLNPNHCITLLLSKNHGVQLGDRWK